MGLFDANDGGLFDFNSDGNITWDEKHLDFKIFEECSKEQEDDFDDDLYSDLFDDTDDYDRYEWRSYCENGMQFGVDPDDYETEEEYKKALNEAKYGWRKYCESPLGTGVFPEDYETEEDYQEALEEERTAWRGNCEDGTDYGIDPDDFETEEKYEEALLEAQERVINTGITLNFSVNFPGLDKLNEIDEEDYPNKRRYNAACTLANEFLICDSDYNRKKRARCQFIKENADIIPAADYLSHIGEFLYSQAIKDNFSIPCSLPDEDETREIAFYEVLCKIAKRDVPLSFNIWDWCLKQFLPYGEYDEFCGNDLSIEVFDYLFSFPDGYKTKLVHYMDEDDSFCKTVIMASSESSYKIAELIAEAVKENLYKTAEFLFKTELEKANGEWKKINDLTDGVIIWCKNYEELESIEYFRDNLLPMVKAIQIGMVQDKIEEWEKEIAEYIDNVEDECERYAFTRKNAWRKNVPNGEAYGLDPLYYDTEQKYLEALNEKKYGWRKWYRERDNHGLNPDDFETRKEYQEAFEGRLKEVCQQERDKMLKAQQLVQQEKIQEYQNDKTIYTYCGVILPFSPRPYSFRTEDKTIQIGDTVIVPVGADKKEMKGKVVSIGQYLRLGVPYPVEKSKMIIRKVVEEKLDNNE